MLYFYDNDKKNCPTLRRAGSYALKNGVLKVFGQAAFDQCEYLTNLHK